MFGLRLWGCGILRQLPSEWIQWIDAFVFVYSEVYQWCVCVSAYGVGGGIWVGMGTCL